MRAGPFRWTALLGSLALAGPFVTTASAQNGGDRLQASSEGRELYLSACANCHGADGTGAAAVEMGLSIQPPDFTESSFASREPMADWAGVVTHGGPIRGFDRQMPAFGEALTRAQIDRILEYVQTLYPDKSWPRGEFNLPLALGTEKAFPEDEVVFKTTVATGDAGSVMNKLIYEKRFGAQTQLEVVVPFGWQEGVSDAGPTGEWGGGMGDVAIGLKRALFHNLGVGTIVSFTMEAILPTGDESEGFGKGYTVFEPFFTMGQLLPASFFLQIQTGAELPTDTDQGENEWLFRAALGRSFTAGGEWGRTLSPMVEFLGAGEMEGGASVWDIVPEMQVTLNQRQHIMANFGVRLPLTEREGRKPQILAYILWDWFDGGFFEGW